MVSIKWKEGVGFLMGWELYDPNSPGPREHAEVFRKHKKKFVFGFIVIATLLVWWGEYGFGV